ncbi:MAG: PIN domain-containing protein [Gemmatimonadota bacterium]
MTRVLIDVNVVLDVLADREPFAEDSAAVLGDVEAGNLQGYLAAHAVTTLHFLLTQHLGRARTRRALSDLLSLLEVVPVDEDRIHHALAANWADFEDAVQAACAEKEGVAYLVARNKRDFRKSAIKAVTPAELLALLPS